LEGDFYTNKVQKRIVIFGFTCFAVFFLYIVKLFSLQIVHGSFYKKRAKDNASDKIIVPAKRGEIYDRNYDLPLVMDINAYAIDITPSKIPEEKKDDVIKKLSKTLDLSIKYITEIVDSCEKGFEDSKEIKSGLTFDIISKIAEEIESFPGISWYIKPKRIYMESGSINHIIGYIGDITTDEHEILHNKGYTEQSVLGKAGIEKSYDRELRGEEGIKTRIVDVIGRKIIDVKKSDNPGKPGNDIILTIDRRIQTLCEKALGERMGSIIVLRPSSGEILAMVSYPWYDPNLIISKDRRKEITQLRKNINSPFLNRAIQSSYSPASVFKIVMTAGILEEDAFPVQKKVQCRGRIKIGNRYFHCHRKAGHGYLSLYEALAESCDIYYYTMGLEYLGVDTISYYAGEFGFGEITSIDLPNEIVGIVPTPEWKKERYKMPWVGGDTVNMSIGQGFLTVTPIQMANMMAMVVNEGVIYKPHLMKEIISSENKKIIKHYKRQVLRKSDISTDTFKKLKKALRFVITNGTANPMITTKAVDIAGKTGTGEVGLADRWNAWFLAYGPYETNNPDEQVVVVTMVESTNEWEWWAIKAANVIFQGIFADEDYDESVKALNWGWLMKKKEIQ